MPEVNGKFLPQPDPHELVKERGEAAPPEKHRDPHASGMERTVPTSAPTVAENCHLQTRHFAILASVRSCRYKPRKAITQSRPAKSCEFNTPRLGKQAYLDDRQKRNPIVDGKVTRPLRPIAGTSLPMWCYEYHWQCTRSK